MNERVLDEKTTKGGTFGSNTNLMSGGYSDTDLMRMTPQ